MNTQAELNEKAIIVAGYDSEDNPIIPMIMQVNARSEIFVIEPRYIVVTESGERFILEPDWIKTKKENIDQDALSVIGTHNLAAAIKFDCEDMINHGERAETIEIAGIIFNVENIGAKKNVASATTA